MAVSADRSECYHQVPVIMPALAHRHVLLFTLDPPARSTQCGQSNQSGWWVAGRKCHCVVCVKFVDLFLLIYLRIKKVNYPEHKKFQDMDHMWLWSIEAKCHCL